jgi:ParB-like chromosome segregation protein Spo0J
MQQMGRVENLVIAYDNPARFKNYERNARVHSPEQIAEIVASMGEYGFYNPILVDENDEIIAGHGRQEAALSENLATIPYIVLRGLSDEQKRALRIADNKIALNASWDTDLLSFELDQLKGIDGLITGFQPGELEKLMGVDQLDEEDATRSRPLPDKAAARKTLAERFGVPPFTILNAREGWWQDRKRAWVALGLKSELGRLEGATAPEVEP